LNVRRQTGLDFGNRWSNHLPDAAAAGFTNDMSVIIILMLASLLVGLVFVGAFVWSVRSGQYEDTKKHEH
jgi:cbb3-type cytochrome oxidase maturation protein